MSDPILALPAREEPLLLPPPIKSSRPSSEQRRRRNRIIAIVLAILVVLLLIGWFFHHRQAASAREANEKARDRLPSVGVITVKPSPSSADLRLPGSITPITVASLFARASGYLSERYVDIGDTVRRGQVLAVIDSPDLDQQLAMARQQLAQARSAVDDAKARVDLAKVTDARLQTLVKDQAVSQQDADQGRQNLDTAKAGVTSSNANVGAAQASVDRLVVLQGYEKLRAPFDGIVTARNVDVGALINAAGSNSAASGSSGVAMNSSSASNSTGSTGPSTSGSAGGQTQNSAGGSTTEMFQIAQVDRVRVFVTVPQENASVLESGSDADVFVQGFDQPFKGRVTRTARSLDPSARTLLTEVQVANPKQQLVPGMYAEVGFRVPRQGAPMLVQGEAVIARADGLSVAVIEDLRPEDKKRLPKKDPDEKDPAKDPDHARRIHLQKVEVGRDYGTVIEITRGLEPGKTIVANPGDEVEEDALVLPHEQKDGKGEDSQQGGDKPASGNASPSMEAPTKGRK